MRRFGAVATLALLALVPSGAGAAERPLLGIVYEGRDGAYLVRVNADTLQPQRRGRVALGRAAGAWTFSPDGKRIAIGSYRTLGLRIVDIESSRVVRDVKTRNGRIDFAAWLTPRRIVGWEMNGTFAVDAVTGRMLRYEPHEGALIDAEAARDAIVLLLSPGPDSRWCRLAVVGLDAHLRHTELDRIRCTATFVGEGDVPEAARENRRPGLAVDDDRAFVFGGSDEPAASVDLRTLQTTYHALGRQPSARAKVPLLGPTRDAVALGDGIVAVTGYDYVDHRRDERGIIDSVSVPAGLTLVDTRTWESRRIDDATAQVLLDGPRLLAFGSWRDREGTDRGDGLRAYRRDGSLVYEALRGQPVHWLRTAAGTAVVADGRELLRLDAATGAVRGTVQGRLPELLTAPLRPLR